MRFVFQLKSAVSNYDIICAPQPSSTMTPATIRALKTTWKQQGRESNVCFYLAKAGLEEFTDSDVPKSSMCCMRNKQRFLDPSKSVLLWIVVMEANHLLAHLNSPAAHKWPRPQAMADAGWERGVSWSLFSSDEGMEVRKPTSFSWPTRLPLGT